MKTRIAIFWALETLELDAHTPPLLHEADVLHVDLALKPSEFPCGTFPLKPNQRLALIRDEYETPEDGDEQHVFRAWAYADAEGNLPLHFTDAHGQLVGSVPAAHGIYLRQLLEQRAQVRIK